LLIYLAFPALFGSRLPIFRGNTVHIHPWAYTTGLCMLLLGMQVLPAANAHYTLVRDAGIVKVNEKFVPEKKSVKSRDLFEVAVDAQAFCATAAVIRKLLHSKKYVAPIKVEAHCGRGVIPRIGDQVDYAPGGSDPTISYVIFPRRT
jgi:hypothetical protein